METLALTLKIGRSLQAICELVGHYRRSVEIDQKFKLNWRSKLITVGQQNILLSFITITLLDSFVKYNGNQIIKMY